METINWTSSARSQTHWELYTACQGCQGVLSLPSAGPSISHRLKGIFFYPQPMWTLSVLLAICFIQGSKLSTPSPALIPANPGGFRGRINNTWCKEGRSKWIQKMMKGSNKTENQGREYQGGVIPPAPLWLHLSHPWTPVWSRCNWAMWKNVLVNSCYDKPL